MQILAVLFTGLMLFSALYSPQTVYPVLIGQFSVEPTHIALLQTATFIPLTISPIFYGLMIDRFSPLKVLRFALFFLAAGEVMFAASGSFYMLLFSRFFQGLFIPAGMTAVVSYISTSYERENIQKYISWYMASTMAGGVAGRIAVGFFSSIFSWRVSFAVLAVSVFACFALTLFLKDEKVPEAKSLTGIKEMLLNTEYLKPVFTAFFAFIVFSSIMNFYSIRLRELSPSLNEFLIGTAYIGSLFGSVTAYLTPAFSRFAGSYKKTVTASFLFMLAALMSFRIAYVPTTIATLFIFCGAFIVIHTSCSGLLNKYAKVSKGAVNGVYFTVYYFGGVIGSSLPGLVYDAFGWGSFLTLLSVSAVIGLTLSLFFRIEA